MGLMQLLTVGRSLSEAKDIPHRYKLRTGEWPSFGHSEGRIGRTGQRESAEASTATAEQAMKSESVTEQGTEVKQAFPQGRWTMPGNPFRAERGTRGGGVVRPTQGELSLDKVKSVRNDLSEADLELVPVKAAPPAAESPFAARVETPVQPSAWVRLKAWVRAKAGK